MLFPATLLLDDISTLPTASIIFLFFFFAAFFSTNANKEKKKRDVMKVMHHIFLFIKYTHTHTQ